MKNPSTTAIVYRVSYTRSSRKHGGWTYKLFNSEDAALRYIENLLKPDDEKTPDKFRGLPEATVDLSYGLITWQPHDAHGKRAAQLPRTRRVAPKAFDTRED